MKKIICLILCLCFAFLGCSCSDLPEVMLSYSNYKYSVGDQFMVKVTFNKFEGVKTIGIRPVFDSQYLELVDAKILVEGAVVGADGGVGVVLFNDLQTINDTVVFEFSLVAKNTVSSTEISCDVSVMGAGDAKIEVEEIPTLIVKIK